MQFNATTIESPETQPKNWLQIFNTSLLSTLIESPVLDGLSSKEDSPHRKLETLIQSPEFESLILAAQNLSKILQIEPELATEKLIRTFREIDTCWKDILIKKGAESLLQLKD